MYFVRDELFVTSKLWNTYHHPQHVEEAYRKSLSDLQLEYLDLYLIHFPIRYFYKSFKEFRILYIVFSLKYVPIEERYPPGWVADPSVSNKMDLEHISVQETWRAMEALVEKGLVK